MLILESAKQQVTIDAGELIGYKVAGHEYIHQKGSPGWGSSDTEMFPIIGPTAANGFMVETPKGATVQDQHGLLREMEYQTISKSDTKAIFGKTYRARTPVENSKFPLKSNKQWLSWPYNFSFEKAFRLSDKGLEITFTIAGDRDSPYMLGYHPAFRIVTEHPMILAEDRQITLDEVLEVGSRALQIPDCEALILKDKNELSIRTEGFGHFMLWTEVRNMICIEPITFYPYAVEPKNLHEGFAYVYDEPKQFKVYIEVSNSY